MICWQKKLKWYHLAERLGQVLGHIMVGSNSWLVFLGELFWCYKLSNFKRVNDQFDSLNFLP